MNPVEQRSNDLPGGYSRPPLAPDAPQATPPSARVVYRENFIVIGEREFVHVYRGEFDGHYVLPPASGTSRQYTVKNQSAKKVVVDAINGRIDGHQQQRCSPGASITVVDYGSDEWGII